MVEIIWTEPALSDLNDIAEYIAVDNLVAARALVQRVFSKIEHLELFPESGRVPSEIPHLPYRELVISPCRIFYKIEENKLFILFVMREERDLRKFLLNQRG